MSDNILRRAEDDAHEWGVLRQYDDFGLLTVDLLRPPGRFWSDEVHAPPLVRQAVDLRRTMAVPTPAALLQSGPDGETWQSQSKRSLARLAAWFLVGEDPQSRLLARPVATLAHQASLVAHVLETPGLERVLIADEVGLGKTVEAGLIVQSLLHKRPQLRVLYLAPARLVRNVRHELTRLGLSFRIWVAGPDRDANLADSLVIASIHRAAGDGHQQDFAQARPWDVIIVDECHHLSDWAKGGGKPVQRYKLVDQLRKRLSSSGRLILMSGTPHQGHPERFENILALLQQQGEPKNAVRGRVIYRTKEDVTDWDGAPLFPLRKVNPAIEIDLGFEYRRWLEGIHDFFEPVDESTKDARRRAMGWRCGQALQWATSSVEAGLGYLVRQAVRVGWGLDRAGMCEALEALRPYRGGSVSESPPSLLERLRAEVGRQQTEADIDDIEEIDDDGAGWRPDPARLSSLLREGVALIANEAPSKWRHLEDRILRSTDGEKVVLFAQPIETVTALSRHLERSFGRRPAIIIGAQDERDRAREIDSFWRPDGPRFLVSSRAGGEGINLQVARRLVHLDVPWNPMELEQRVGRVHRFLSKRTIVVDTLIVRNSREEHAYSVARRKLREISSTMVPEDKFDALFSRVMSLVPPEGFADVLAQKALGPLDERESHEVSELVTAGFQRWKDFHSRHSETHKQIRNLDAGQVTWNDLSDFAREHLGAEPVSGFDALKFEWKDGEIASAVAPASVLRLDGSHYSCGEHGGMPVTCGHAVAQPLGVNVPVVAEALRKFGISDKPAGAAHLRLPDNLPPWAAAISRPFGLLVLACQLVRAVDQSWNEVGLALQGHVVALSGTSKLERAQLAELIRMLRQATVRREPEDAPQLVSRLVQEETRLVQELRRPPDTAIQAGIRHVVFPVFAGVIA